MSRLPFFYTIIEFEAEKIILKIIYLCRKYIFKKLRWKGRGGYFYGSFLLYASLLDV